MIAATLLVPVAEGGRMKRLLLDKWRHVAVVLVWALACATAPRPAGAEADPAFCNALRPLADARGKSIDRNFTDYTEDYDTFPSRKYRKFPSGRRVRISEAEYKRLRCAIVAEGKAIARRILAMGPRYKTCTFYQAALTDLYSKKYSLGQDEGCP